MTLHAENITVDLFFSFLVYSHSIVLSCVSPMYHVITYYNQMRIQYDMSLHPRKPVLGVRKQQRRRPACAYVQSDQRLCYSFIEMYHI